MALRHPDRPAVRCSGRIVSHRELDEMVGALDSALPRGQTVAVRSGDRLDYIVGMLAAFRSGGTYLPLDAGAPAEREAFMLKDAGATVLLRDGVLTLLAEERSQTDTPSYAIYTSGTTGLPKGVWVPVDALSEHIAATVDRMGVTAQDVVLQFARPTVDVSIEQTLVALTAGACLVLPDRQLLSPRELLALLDAEGVTIANLPAGYFHDLVAELRERGGSPRALRLMVSGSDRLEPAAAAAWRELTGVPLLNAYGPTETVITATVHGVGPQAAGEPVGIGAAVGERTLHILDEQLRPCPAGTAGELFIGGPLLAWGYRRRPGLSAERFVADPFSTLPGARMYRTGDLVRRQSEGGPLEYLGRTDHQLKIRGFRVEPGEVEQAVAGYPGITGCVVVEREGRLVAYATGAVPEYGQIREYLRERLPEQLLPSAVVALEAFPLTVNGKTDRAALPEPTAVPVAQAGFVAPRTAAERLIAQVWAEVLGVDLVGAEDNFFHLGGDSLTAVRMIGRVFDDFGMVSPYAIFDAPTLAAFAAAVSATGEPAGAPPSLDAKPNPLGTASLGTASLGTAPLSKFQRGLFFLDHWNAGAATYNVPWVFRFQGTLDPELLRGALDVVVSRHAPLRTVFVLEESGPQQRISDRITLPFTLVDAAADQVDGLIAEAARQPFELETGPLFRVDAVRTPDDRLTVVFTFHHLVWDEGSLPVLEQELQEAYQALAEGRPHRLPELRVGYPEYSAGQYSDGAAEAQLGYWQEALRGVAADSVLPTDHPRPDLQAFRGAQHRYALPPEAALAVRELARGEDATPYMVLLAALALTLHRRSGRTDLVVGAPVSLRGRAELTGLIGYFVNLLPLRVQVDPGASFRELVRQVRKVCVGGYRNQDAPFDDIAGLVLDDRPGDRIPLCQIVFELHPTDTRELSVGGVPVSRELHLNDVSRFDLTISVDDRGTDFTGRFEYDSDLFEAATIAALRDDWLATLAELVPAPATPAPAIPAPTAPSPTAPPQIVVETVQARMERLVADTMREVLDRPRVDREDNFFRIGGTSLAALRVAMRLSRETGTRVPPHLVFRAKTVRAIAEQLAAQQQTGAAPAPQAAGKGARQ
ncbi:condensation domain-containing protein [Streptacidiphilus albus]|uniref:condensation domain-containing protein n=1 Tax=Streptacidiphilus albus TaxID=105425 RepID=UPI00069235AC|nr:condensation domain-containing protein [Streptacidiphilus albus]